MTPEEMAELGYMQVELIGGPLDGSKLNYEYGATEICLTAVAIYPKGDSRGSLRRLYVLVDGGPHEAYKRFWYDGVLQRSKR